MAKQIDPVPGPGVRGYDVMDDRGGQTSMTLETKDRVIMAYFYAIYLTALLIHRVYRDDRRCREKYGAAWAAYCAAVPYRMIPWVW